MFCRGRLLSAVNSFAKVPELSRERPFFLLHLTCIRTNSPMDRSEYRPSSGKGRTRRTDYRANKDEPFVSDRGSRDSFRSYNQGDRRHVTKIESSLSGRILRAVSGEIKAPSLTRLQKRVEKHSFVNLQRARAAYKHPKVLASLNIFTFCYLLAHAIDLVRNIGGTELGVPNFQCGNALCSFLPYPVDLALRSRTPISSPYEVVWSNNSVLQERAGYAEVRPGTFRPAYPTEDVSHSFDDIHVITNEKCPKQWIEFQRRAREAKLPATQWPVMSYKRISFSEPPLPVHKTVLTEHSAGGRVVASVLKRQISYLLAHRSIWSHVASSSRQQRVLIIDDTLFLNERLRRIIPSMFNQIDQESLAFQSSWHIVNFRRKLQNSPSTSLQNEAVWCSNPRYNHAVVRANPSFGAGMYALSAEGARWLLDHIQEYRAPMDIEFAQLQKEFPEEFVMLSACNNDEPTDFCPEITEDISVNGQSKTQHFECVWRRLQERRVGAMPGDEPQKVSIPK